MRIELIEGQAEETRGLVSQEIESFERQVKEFKAERGIDQAHLQELKAHFEESLDEALTKINDIDGRVSSIEEKDFKS